MTILDEAKSIVYGDREESYSPPENSFAQIAALWSPVLGITITPEQVGLCMIQLKVARQRHKHKRDNLVDIAGYAECISRLDEGKGK